MVRFSLAQLSSFTVACAVYFGAMPVMCMRLRSLGANDIDATFLYMAEVSWLILAVIYAWWRQLTPLAVHLSMPLSILPMGILMLMFDDEVQITLRDVAGAVAGPGCWAGVLFSFPVSLILLVVSAVRGQRTDPVAASLMRKVASLRSGRKPAPDSDGNRIGIADRPSDRPDST